MTNKKEKKSGDTYQRFLDDRHAGFQTPENLIEEVVEKVTGTNIISRNKIIAGEVNEVYQITAQNEQKVIVRISRLGPASFEAEEKVINWVRKVGVPAPKVLLVQNAKFDSLEITFCVEEKIEGVPLKDIMDNLDRGSLKKIVFEAGGILSKIHSIPVKIFGYMDDPKKYKSWEDFVFGLDKDLVYKAGEWMGVDNKLIKKAFGILESEPDIFKVTEPKLLHGDFSPKHWLIERGKINGVIDFEDAKGGDPVRDLAWLEFFYPEPFPFETFLEGYTNKIIFDENFDKKMKLYRLQLGLDLLRYYYSEKNAPGGRHAKKTFMKALSVL